MVWTTPESPGEVMAPLMLEAELVDAEGRPVTGRDIRFDVTLVAWSLHGFGTPYTVVDSALARTDARGRGTVQVSLPFSGEYRVTVGADGVDSVGHFIDVRPRHPSAYRYVWEEGVPPYQDREVVFAVAFEDDIYVLAGDCPFWHCEWRGGFWRVDPRTRGWTELPMSFWQSTLLREARLAVASSAGIHVFTARSHYLYEPDRGQWSERSLPVEVGLAPRVAHRDRLYVFLPSATARYDVHTDAWSYVEAEWGEAQWAAAASGGIAFLVGDDRCSSPWRNCSTEVRRVDLATNRWTRLPDAPYARPHMTPVTLEDELCLVGGALRTNRGERGLNDLHCLDLPAGSWRAEVPWPEARVRQPAVVHVDGEVWLFGGYEIDPLNYAPVGANGMGNLHRR